jgi:Fe-S-cluster containining protein
MIYINCKQCGKCCKWYSDTRLFYIELEDYDRWIINDREDILYYIRRDSEGVMVGWIDPETEIEVDLCPFLEEITKDRFICSIHDTKPKHCRKYPLNDHQSKEIGCPGYLEKNNINKGK